MMLSSKLKSISILQATLGAIKLINSSRRMQPLIPLKQSHSWAAIRMCSSARLTQMLGMAAEDLFRGEQACFCTTSTILKATFSTENNSYPRTFRAKNRESRHSSQSSYLLLQIKLRQLHGYLWLQLLHLVHYDSKLDDFDDRSYTSRTVIYNHMWPPNILIILELI